MASATDMKLSVSTEGSRPGSRSRPGSGFSQTGEPDSPDSPIKSFVRRNSQHRPSGKTIHNVNVPIAAGAIPKGYNSPAQNLSTPKALSKVLAKSPSEELNTTFNSTGTNGSGFMTRPIDFTEIKRMDRDAVSYFRNVRSINTQALHAIETPPKLLVRRRSLSQAASSPNLLERPGSAPGKHLEPIDIGLQKLAAKRLSPEEREQLMKVFQEFDEDNSGSIDLDELTKMCTQLGGKISRTEAKMLMEQLDKDKSGAIDFEEFVLFWTSQPSLGKYRSLGGKRQSLSGEELSGVQALMGGLLKNTGVAIAKNTLLSRLNKSKEGLRRRNTVE